MKLNRIKKICNGTYLNMYIAEYKEGKHTKPYELVSRNKDLTLETFGKDKISNAVGIIALNKDKSKILLQREFRMSTNNWVYNFPGGLIDEEETSEQASIRELGEETGLDIIEVLDILPPAYTTVGFSDELVETIVCIADGEFRESTSIDEQIEAKWYTKEEIQELFRDKVYMSLRTQAILYMWISSN